MSDLPDRDGSGGVIDTGDVGLLDDEPVHTWFELSYANYAVLHRTLLQSMPLEWQHRFVTCMEEMRDAFAHVEQAPGYQVTPCRWQAPDEVEEEVLKRLGFDCPAVGITAYLDPDGREVEGWKRCVPVPVSDPVPHYDRGRAQVRRRAPGVVA